MRSASRLVKFLAVLAALAAIATVVAVVAFRQEKKALPKVLVSKPSESFYKTPSDLSSFKDGDVLRTEELIPNGDARSYAILYRSQTRTGTPIAVSAIVSIPNGIAPENGWGVIAFAHGLTGVADECAPSRILGSTATALPGDPLRKGYVVVATDYEGLGTDGIHPFIVGVSEAHAVLDSARAVLKMKQANAAPEVVIWGVSQGGHAALFSAALAQSYAPEVPIKGVVASSPAASPAELLKDVVEGGGDRSFLLYGALGFAAGYPELNPNDVINASALPGGQIDPGCINGLGSKELPDDLLKQSPLNISGWKLAIEENAVPVSGQYSFPLLIAHGLADTLIPPSMSTEVFSKLCAAGNKVVFVRVPGAQHALEFYGNGEFLMSFTNSARATGALPTPPPADSTRCD